jgi:hypothetical protein
MRTLYLVLLFGLLAGCLWAAEPAPKAADEKVGLKTGWYIEPGVSALIFDAPDRDLPIFAGEGSGLITRNGKLLSAFDDEAVVPAGRLAVGYVFGDMPSWLGKNFRAEGSTNFYWVNREDRKTLPSGLDIVGIMYDRGTPTSGMLDYAALLNGEALSLVVKRDAKYRYVDGNLTVKTDYHAGEMVSFSPSLGFVYANLNYESEVGCVGVEDTYVLKEGIDTDFFGAAVGLDLNLQVTKQLKITVGGTISPFWAGTDYRNFSSWNGPDGYAPRGFDGDDGQFTWRATGMGAIAYQPLSWFRISAFGGVEHWADIARIHYPDYRAGADATVPGSGFPKLKYDSMTNFRAGLNFTFIIGK